MLAFQLKTTHHLTNHKLFLLGLASSNCIFNIRLVYKWKFSFPIQNECMYKIYLKYVGAHLSKMCQ